VTIGPAGRALPNHRTVGFESRARRPYCDITGAAWLVAGGDDEIASPQAGKTTVVERPAAASRTAGEE
jgi:hypothetical protein